MMKFEEMSKDELLSVKGALEAEFGKVQEKNLKLDMSRGKPSKEQLDLSEGLLKAVSDNAGAFAEDGTDCRNYGMPFGLPEARKLMGDIMGADASQVIIYGNASLNIMFDTVARSFTHGVMGGTPWSKLDKVKFLCPVPGYDRHFAVTEYFGVELVSVPMTEDGPDMNMVERLVTHDDSIKGIWCVPKYSNPQGYTYSDEVVRRFARLSPAAKDFRIFWDNAYIVHHLYDEEEKQDQLLNILEECKAAGNPDLVYEFASTSKVSYAGGGIAAVAASEANLADFKRALSFQTIGHDKLNQLRHVKFFKDADGVREHMKKHAASMRPKFEAVQSVLSEELGGLGIGSWTKPNGGYFISFESLEGCAGDIVAKAKEAGLIMTGAGATYPYGNDPYDSNIRIAPSLPTIDELLLATKVFVLSVKICSIDKILENKESMCA